MSFHTTDLSLCKTRNLPQSYCGLWPDLTGFEHTRVCWIGPGARKPQTPDMAVRPARMQT